MTIISSTMRTASLNAASNSRNNSTALVPSKHMMPRPGSYQKTYQSIRLYSSQNNQKSFMEKLRRSSEVFSKTFYGLKKGEGPSPLGEKIFVHPKINELLAKPLFKGFHGTNLKSTNAEGKTMLEQIQKNSGLIVASKGGLFFGDEKVALSYSHGEQKDRAILLIGSEKEPSFDETGGNHPNHTEGTPVHVLEVFKVSREALEHAEKPYYSIVSRMLIAGQKALEEAMKK